MSFSISDDSPYGVPYAGNGIIYSQSKILSKLVKQDHGIDNLKKNYLLAAFESPDVVESLFVGATGMIVANLIAKYTNMSTPAKTLLSLAGFGIGNTLYEMLKNKRYTSFNASTGTSKIIL